LTNNTLKIAEHTLLDSSRLDSHQLETVLGNAVSRKIDFGDVYLQSSMEESWFLENGIVKEGGFSIHQGFGLRLISGEKTGFAYADSIDLKTLKAAATSAKSIAYGQGHSHIRLQSSQETPRLYSAHNPLQSLSEQDKVLFMRELDAKARQLDSRVIQVFVSLSGSYDVMMVMNSEGHLSSDCRPLLHLSVRVIVEENGHRESGSAGGGDRSDYQMFKQNNLALSYVEKAVRQAVTNLTAKPAPSGMMPVVLGPGWPAILLHEAIGHGLEGDFNRKKSSAFSDRLGERVASDICTIVDDGTIPNRRGSLNVDDEGTPSQRTVLIENGILKNYMQDKLNARLMGMSSTGNGRRESYSSLPLPRMTNTCLLPGKDDPKDIIKSIKKGIYAVDFSGGQVDITSGKFVFTLSEAYWVENGEVKYPIKGATLIGNGPDVLTKVSMLGNDFALDSGIGTCGKDGQSVPVGVGQPTLKIDELTVGGVV
jgi:TldD protein